VGVSENDFDAENVWVGEEETESEVEVERVMSFVCVGGFVSVSS